VRKPSVRASGCLGGPHLFMKKKSISIRGEDNLGRRGGAGMIKENATRRPFLYSDRTSLLGEIGT